MSPLPPADEPASPTDEDADGSGSSGGPTGPLGAGPTDEPDESGGPDLPPPSLDDLGPMPRRTDEPAIVGVSFGRPVVAQEFLLAMKRLKLDGALDLQDAVLVQKADDGKVHVTETVDPSPGRTALSGAVWTGLLGLLVGGPVGWLAGLGVGAGAGAVTAKIVDLGIPDDWVAWFEDAVQPGTATVVILAADIDLRALEREARRFHDADLLYTTLPPETIDRLTQAFRD